VRSYSINEVARLAGHGLTPDVLRAWDANGLLPAERRDHPKGFGRTVRVYDSERTLAAMAFAELRARAGVTPGVLRKAGRPPGEIWGAQWLIFDRTFVRWTVCADSEAVESALRLWAGIVTVISLEEKREILRSYSGG
jgi:hypothetical protein